MDVAIVSRCAEAFFNITGEDKSELIEGVETFNYLGRMIDWSDNDWSAVFRNSSKARQVCRRIGKILRRERAELFVSSMFYREVVQAVLIFGEDTCILLA